MCEVPHMGPLSVVRRLVFVVDVEFGSKISNFGDCVKDHARMERGCLVRSLRSPDSLFIVFYTLQKSERQRSDLRQM